MTLKQIPDEDHEEVTTEKQVGIQGKHSGRAPTTEEVTNELEQVLNQATSAMNGNPNGGISFNTPTYGNKDA